MSRQGIEPNLSGADISRSQSELILSYSPNTLIRDVLEERGIEVPNHWISTKSLSYWAKAGQIERKEYLDLIGNDHAKANEVLGGAVCTCQSPVMMNR